MKNIIIQFDKNEAKERALEYFLDICGLYRRKDINPMLVEESLKTLDDIFDRIKINAIFSKYEAESIQGKRLICDGISFKCNALTQVLMDDIVNVFIYMLNIGDIPLAHNRVLYQVYYDMWLTAFVDAGRDMLQEYIKLNILQNNFAISDSFGPGFFGMPAQDVEKFFYVLNADKIGASMRPDGLMNPIKSYAGFFIVSTKEEALPSKDCENCLSSRKTCSYCKSGRERGAPEELRFMAQSYS
ncbi:MAG: vitamin B12 dependent methionine synthase [Deltaproteobacteria bacterium]|jgi:hypothetical protein|nr:vitamin B12 dependent methionine synthase [Deltaproteobacteria bacterium]